MVSISNVGFRDRFEVKRRRGREKKQIDQRTKVAGALLVLKEKD